MTRRYEVWECSNSSVIRDEETGEERPERLTRHGLASTILRAVILADQLDPEEGDVDWGAPILIWDREEEEFLDPDVVQAVRMSPDYPGAES